MRSIQWNILGGFFILMDWWLISLDRLWGSNCGNVFDLSQLTKADVVACVSGEMFEPFIWILFPLGIVFFICGSIEKRGRKIEAKGRKKNE